MPLRPLPPLPLRVSADRKPVVQDCPGPACSALRGEQGPLRGTKTVRGDASAPLNNPLHTPPHPRPTSSLPHHPRPTVTTTLNHSSVLPPILGGPPAAVVIRYHPSSNLCFPSHLQAPSPFPPRDSGSGQGLFGTINTCAGGGFVSGHRRNGRQCTGVRWRSNEGSPVAWSSTPHSSYKSFGLFLTFT